MTASTVGSRHLDTGWNRSGNATCNPIAAATATAAGHRGFPGRWPPARRGDDVPAAVRNRPCGSTARSNPATAAAAHSPPTRRHPAEPAVGCGGAAPCGSCSAGSSFPRSGPAVSCSSPAAGTIPNVTHRAADRRDRVGALPAPGPARSGRSSAAAVGKPRGRGRTRRRWGEGPLWRSTAGRVDVRINHGRYEAGVRPLTIGKPRGAWQNSPEMRDGPLWRSTAGTVDVRINHGGRHEAGVRPLTRVMACCAAWVSDRSAWAPRRPG